MNSLTLESAYKFFKKFPPNHVFHRLPVHYKKFLIGMHERPTPVHYVPVSEKWYKHPDTGERKRRVDVPIPLIFPKEIHEGLWGGEGIIKGYIKRNVPYAKRIPHWWTPILKRVVLYSEILDEYMNVIATERTMDLIDQDYGFDNYILKTRPVDLRSNLALKLRKRMILALIHKTSYKDNPEKQAEIYKKYQEFIVPEEEAEWMGLTLTEALQKQLAIEAAINAPKPLKHKYRKELFEKLKEMKAQEAGEKEIEALRQSWFNKWNPFSKEGRSDVARSPSNT